MTDAVAEPLNQEQALLWFPLWGGHGDASCPMLLGERGEVKQGMVGGRLRGLGLLPHRRHTSAVGASGAGLHRGKLPARSSASQTPCANSEPRSDWRLDTGTSVTTGGHFSCP